ncbi:hypothetical protein PG994_001039 [Apiospora phragmitis]|uniref:Uncharacterized protein n=1 Tax=Apiospora phragmitis TaxID=2905665 RepID=A0ABR1WRB2_9PEZI
MPLVNDTGEPFVRVRLGGGAEGGTGSRCAHSWNKAFRWQRVPAASPRHDATVFAPATPLFLTNRPLVEPAADIATHKLSSGGPTPPAADWPGEEEDLPAFVIMGNRMMMVNRTWRLANAGFRTYVVHLPRVPGDQLK